jgi:hypothetical protein
MRSPLFQTPLSKKQPGPAKSENALKPLSFA